MRALTYAALTGAAISVVCAVYQERREIAKRLLALYVNDLGPSVKNVARALEFGVVEAGGYGVNHGHPDNAGDRLVADRLMTELADRLGLQRYDLSIARRTARMRTATGFPVAGRRRVHWAADFAAGLRDDPVPANALVTMVDQDFYLEAADFLEFEGHPIAFYTVVPNAVAGRFGQATWFIEPDGTFREVVCGGRSYAHALWDWSGENVLIGRVLYDIERVVSPADPTRCVVVLCPTVSWQALSMPMFMGLVSAAELDFAHPRRLGGVEVIGNAGQQVVAAWIREPGKPGRVSLRFESVRDGSCLDVPEEQFVALRAKALMDAKGGVPHLTVYYLQSHAKSIGIPEGDQAARVLLLSAVNCNSALPADPVAFVPLVAGYTPAEPRVGSAVPCPVRPAVASADLAASLFVAVKGMQQRINRIGADDVGWFVHAAIAGARSALIEHLSAGGYLEPITAEEVREIQSRAAQRARNDQLFNNGVISEARLRVRLNPKGETLNAAKGRKIVLCPVEHTVELSRYMYPVEQRIKALVPAWAPGKNPLELAETLRSVVVAGEPCGTDYSAMDDTVSVWLREVIADPVLCSMFAGKAREDLAELVALEHSVSVYAHLGEEKVRFKTSGGNISGSRITTYLNTVINLVFNAAGKAIADIKASGLKMRSEDWNYELLPIVRSYCLRYYREAFCLVGGDDGVTHVSAVSEVFKIATACGMTLKVDRWYDGRVEFYSRVYPSIETTLASYPCVDRALGKLALARPGDAGFGAKWAGVLASDPITPLVSEYAGALMRVYAPALDAGDKEYQRKVASGAHPVREEDRGLLVGYMSVDLGVSVAEVEAAIAVYRAAARPADIAAVKFAVAPRAEKLPCVWVG